MNEPRPASPASDLTTMAAEAVRFAQELIRIDSTNTGDPDTQGAGETACARLVQGWLEEVGLHGQLYEQTPGRGNLVLRIPGTDTASPAPGALVFHAHTDVVPATAADWAHDPFAGVVADGCLWGRGAVDMKGELGMLVAALRQLKREGFQSRRDLVVAVVADEESGGAAGMRFLVDEHPELLAGVTQAIGELGGFPVGTGVGRRYSVCVGEKAIAWATLRATGTEGHGSLVPNADGAPARLAKALARIVDHDWPLAVDGTSAQVLGILADHLGEDEDAAGATPRRLKPDKVPEAVARWGSVGRWVSVAFRTSSTLTQIHAGNRTNTVPGQAWATVDCRVTPDTEDDFFATFARLAGPDVDIEWDYDVGYTTDFTADDASGLLDDMCAALDTEDPGARLLPYLTAGATDAKSLIRLGIECFGFTPLTPPAGYDFPAMFHGIDERVPIAALEGGTRVLREFLLRQ